MGTSIGVKETKEALVAINELSIHLIEIFKKGATMDAAVGLWKLLSEDDDLRVKLLAAYENYQKIPEELEALDITGVLELMYTQTAYVPAIVGSLRRQNLLPGKS